jgi:ATP-dependent DNA ligase
MAEISSARSARSVVKGLPKRAYVPYASRSSMTWLKCKHSIVGTYPVSGYVPDGKRIESLLVAEPSPRGLRLVGRVGFRMQE